MNPDLGPLSDVAYERSGEGWTLVFVRDIPHPPSKVWAALSDQHQVGYRQERTQRGGQPVAVLQWHRRRYANRVRPCM